MAAEQPTVEYRDVPGFPGYRVGTDGSVWSCWELVTPRAPWVRGDNWHRLNPTRQKGGYLVVSLRPDSRRRPCQLFVHRLVLFAFVGPCPEGMQCCHGNGSQTDNRLENLRWGTAKANRADASRHGTILGERNGRAKLTAAAVRAIRAEYATGRVTQERLARRHGVNHTLISVVVRRKRWSHVL